MGRKHPYCGKSMIIDFPEFPQKLSFLTFSCTVGSLWGNSCNSHMMTKKYDYPKECLNKMKWNHYNAKIWYSRIYLQSISSKWTSEQPNNFLSSIDPLAWLHFSGRKSNSRRRYIECGLLQKCKEITLRHRCWISFPARKMKREDIRGANIVAR